MKRGTLKEWRLWFIDYDYRINKQPLDISLLMDSFSATMDRFRRLLTKSIFWVLSTCCLTWASPKRYSWVRKQVWGGWITTLRGYRFHFLRTVFLPWWFANQGFHATDGLLEIFFCFSKNQPSLQKQFMMAFAFEPLDPLQLWGWNYIMYMKYLM